MIMPDLPEMCGLPEAMRFEQDQRARHRRVVAARKDRMWIANMFERAGDDDQVITFALKHHRLGCRRDHREPASGCISDCGAVGNGA